MMNWRSSRAARPDLHAFVVRGRHAYPEAAARHRLTGDADVDALVEALDAVLELAAAPASSTTAAPQTLSRIQVPADPGPLKRAEDRWKTYTDDPADALTFAGPSLTHTDWMPDNVQIAHGRAWLVDWAWPTLGAAWIDPASWLLRVMARGHTAAEAEAHAARLPAYATADPAHIDLFVRANVNMWNEIEETNGRPWAKIMAHTARTWAQHRETALN